MVEHVSSDTGCLLAELFFLIKRVERAELTGYYCCMRQRLKNINVDMVEHGPSDIGCFLNCAALKIKKVYNYKHSLCQRAEGAPIVVSDCKQLALASRLLTKFGRVQEIFSILLLSEVQTSSFGKFQSRTYHFGTCRYVSLTCMSLSLVIAVSG